MNRYSIARLFSLATTAITCIAALLMGVSWTSSEIELARVDSEQLRHRFMEGQKEEIKQDVERLARYIDYMRSLTENRLREGIRARVYEAHAVARNIYTLNRDKGEKQIGDLIRETLRPIRFNEGRGYFFATNLDGTEELFADRPEMEGTDFSDVQDTRGQFIIRDMIDIVRAQKEGFYEYTWTKPNQDERDFPKIAFVKYFAPLDWLIGTGEYLDDVERDIQEETLAYLESISFGKDGYVFVGRWDGVSLAGPQKGEQMIEVEDVNGVKIVRELIRTARSGGGFVEYVMPALDGKRSLPKISYVLPIADWEWYLEVGAYVTDIEEIIHAREAALAKNLQLRIGRIVLLCLAVFALAVGSAVWVSRRLRLEFILFDTFFSRASDAPGSTCIDTNSLRFRELGRLADGANAMVERWRKTQALLEAVIEQTPAGLLVADAPGGEIRMVNSAALEIRGSDRSDLTQIPFELHPSRWQIFHPDGTPCAPEELPLTRVIATGEPVHDEELIVRRENGESRWVLASAGPVRDDEGRIIAGVVVFPDITERKGTEAEREALIGELERKNAELERFTYTVSHDLKSPLITIRGFLGLLRKDLERGDGEQFDRDWRQIDRAAGNMQELLEDLLGLSRLGRLVNPSEEIDMAALARRAVELVKGRIRARRVRVEVADEMPKAWGDPPRLLEVWQNLIDNAVKFMGAQVEPGVEIGALQKDGESFYFVRDNGLGIEPRYREKIFGLFDRLDTGTAGTGIGLALVNRIVELHGGRVWVESGGLNRGSTFYFTLSPTGNKPV